MPTIRGIAAALTLAAVTACSAQPADPDQQAVGANATQTASAAPAALSLMRLDCGSMLFFDFSKSFSDQQIYPHERKQLTDSCYVITHNGQHLLWDTGLPATLKGKTEADDEMTATLSATVAEQLAKIGLKPGDIDIVGISHKHFDHVGQAAQFPTARLIIGKRDFEETTGKDDPFGPWRGGGKPVTLATGDVDIFGDGSVVALHLPGHTEDHLALLVKLKSGPVLLSGDLYHAAIAREKRGVPPFNTDRNQTLASMDKFEALAKQLGATVIIQHEPADISKLPAFPQTAQ